MTDTERWTARKVLLGVWISACASVSAIFYWTGRLGHSPYDFGWSHLFFDLSVLLPFWSLALAVAGLIAAIFFRYRSQADDFRLRFDGDPIMQRLSYVGFMAVAAGYAVLFAGMIKLDARAPVIIALQLVSFVCFAFVTVRRRTLGPLVVPATIWLPMCTFVFVAGLAGH